MSRTSDCKALTAGCRNHAFGAIVLFSLASGGIAAAAPQISQIEPLALTPGKTVDLLIRGQSLQNPRSLWTTFAARCEFVPAAKEVANKGEQLVCRVTLPRDEQVGVGALRVVTGEGISNPVLVMIDDLPTVAESSDNHTFQQAQRITVPTAIDGQCDSLQEDVFRFHVSAGRRIAFEAVAQRLGSKLDPVLRLLRADGREINRFDDAPGSGGDCRFSHTFEADGDYLLALSDVRHAGGADYRYRLRLGTFPLITAAYPLGGPSGAVVAFDALLLGPSPLVKLNVGLPNKGGARRIVSFDLPSADNGGSGWFEVEAAPGDESLEHEPNDTVADATTARFPGVLNGRFDKSGDCDYFKFTAKKGQHVHGVALSRELGSTADVMMSLQKLDGSTIAEARQERQTVLDAELPENGQYVLKVEDLLVGTVPRLDSGYRIHLSDSFSGFSLQTDAMQYPAPQAGTFVVKVLAKRTGYNGPIELAVDGLGEGVKLDGNTFDGAETLLKITLPPGIAAGTVRDITLVGRAKVGDQTLSIRANERENLRALFPNALSLPGQLEDTIALAVGPPFPPFFELNLAESHIYFPQLVGESSADITINRTNPAFKDPILVIVTGLPAGVTAAVAPIGDGLKAMRLTLKGSPNLPAGKFPLRIVATGKFQDQTRTVVLDHVRLWITKPLVVSVSMLGPIATGGRQQANVRLQRFGNDPQPVRLHVSDGPAGLSAPIQVTVPSRTNEVKIPFTAEATATPGKFKNLVVVASTAVKGQNVTIQSEPAVVEIRPPK